MEMDQLEAFDMVAREGNFSRAAEIIGLTQPAISTRIKLLEAQVGGALFERQGRIHRLTPLGEHFLPFARRILALREDSLQSINHFKQGIQGRVRIAAPTPFLMGYLVDTLIAFQKTYPQIDVQIRERNKTTIFDMLRDNTTTLGLVNAPILDPDCKHLARFQDEIIPVVGAKHWLARRVDEQLMMRDLFEFTIYRVSLYPQMTAFMDDMLAQVRQATGQAITALPMLMALRMVRLGHGITFLPYNYVRNFIETGEILRLHIEDVPALRSEAVLITHTNRELDQAHSQFIQLFANQWHHLRQNTHED